MLSMHFSRVRRLRRGGLSRPHLPLVLQVHTAAGPRAGEEDHGEPQEAHVSHTTPEIVYRVTGYRVAL